MKTVAIIQARMGSSRLPGKVLLDLAGQPMLVRVIERARRAKLVDEVAVATTTDPSDDAIEAMCREKGYSVYRGSQFDVLDRFYGAARTFGVDIIVRLTADCPVIDPDLIDETVQTLLDTGSDFAATRLPPPWHRTYPIGLDVEVCTFAGLERAWNEATLPYEREHVMPYFYDQEGRFKITLLDYHEDYGSLRWTVDTAEDLDLLREIYRRFEGKDDFTWLDVLSLVQRDPELTHFNAGIHHKTMSDVDDRMKGRS